ncbi:MULTISPECIES: adenosine-specific kinase [unclassified Marinitoga]|uniref:adenosine-specific kinase n=1 Tax=unclassified Marinitoga TaxID=2640159 RepID=UPI000641567D|nr:MULTISPECIES: adenosine-specific kinase [unclassified Marinitoga]KLO21151.1 adenosine monophosphate-protein transferase [Marinitoga sp. 1155]NUV00209.1 adenosine monophosphate-protein transferase [Marinitoga sp. 1154]
MNLKFEAVDIKFPSDCNVIVGQSHFIKTVEDIYETIVTTVPQMKFGFAFNEASGPRLVRFDGNDKELIEIAIENAKNVGAGHFFILIIRNGYPINILSRLKQIQEIVNIFAATANPLQVLVAETDLGRGVIGVVDGQSPLGVEGEEDKKKRYEFLRNITGYKR